MIGGSRHESAQDLGADGSTVGEGLVLTRDSTVRRSRSVRQRVLPARRPRSPAISSTSDTGRSLPASRCAGADRPRVPRSRARPPSGVRRMIVSAVSWMRPMMAASRPDGSARTPQGQHWLRRRQSPRRNDPRTQGNTGRSRAFRTPRHGITNRHLRLVEIQASPAACTISCITVAIPPRVGSRMKRSPLQRRVERDGQHARRVGLQIAPQAELLAASMTRCRDSPTGPLTRMAVASADLAHAEPQVRVAHRTARIR